MLERKEEFKRALMLNAIGSLMLVIVAYTLYPLGQPEAAGCLHAFLPLAMACYVIIYGLALLAGRQLKISRSEGGWTAPLIVGGVWMAANVGLALYGMITTFALFMRGL